MLVENYYKQGDKTRILSPRLLMIRVQSFVCNTAVHVGKRGSLPGHKIECKIRYLYDKNWYQHFCFNLLNIC